MMNYFVTYCYTDDYGRALDTQIKWFDTMEEAEEWTAEKKRCNGGYFKPYKIEEGNYNDYLRMVELEKELMELRKWFMGKA